MTTDDAGRAGPRIGTEPRPRPEASRPGPPRASHRAAPDRRPPTGSAPTGGTELDRAAWEAQDARDTRRGQQRQAREQVAARTRPARPRTRRAHLRMARIDPWSVMKVSFMLSIAVAVVFVVAVVVLWSALSAAGVFATINDLVRTQSVFGQEGQSFDVLRYVGLNRVLGITLLLAVVNVVLWTALSTLFTFVYNLTAGLLGGIEVTLAETE